MTNPKTLKPIVMSEEEAAWVKKGLEFLISEAEHKRLFMDGRQVDVFKTIVERL